MKVKRKGIVCLLTGTIAISMLSVYSGENATVNGVTADFSDIKSLDDLQEEVDSLGDAASPEEEQLTADAKALIDSAITEEELASLTAEQAAKLNPICEIWYSEDNSIYNIESYEYTMNDDGKPVSAQSHTEGHMFLKPTYKTDYEYDETGNLTMKSVYNLDDDNALSKSSQYSYDGKGKLIKRVDTYGESPYSNLKSLIYSYSYDKNGQLLEQQIDMYIVGESDAKEKITVTYSDGLISNILEIYYGSTSDVPFHYDFQYEYDEEGREKFCNIIDQDTSDIVRTISYEYDENNICTSTWKTGDILTEIFEFIYDRSLFRFEKIVMDPNGNILSVINREDGDDSEIEDMSYVRIYYR